MYHNVRIQSEQCPCAAQVGRIASYGAIRTEGCKKPHPAIIVSNDELQEDEDGMFYLVLITSNDWLNPQYSYQLTDDMVEGFVRTIHAA